MRQRAVVRYNGDEVGPWLKRNVVIVIPQAVNVLVTKLASRSEIVAIRASMGGELLTRLPTGHE